MSRKARFASGKKKGALTGTGPKKPRNMHVPAMRALGHAVHPNRKAEARRQQCRKSDKTDA